MFGCNLTLKLPQLNTNTTLNPSITSSVLTIIIAQLIILILSPADGPGQSESERRGNNHCNCLKTCYYPSSPGHYGGGGEG